MAVQASGVAAAVAESGLVTLAVGMLAAAAGMAKVGRPEVRQAHKGAAVSADQETVAPLAARAARVVANGGATVVSVDQIVASSVARVARTLTPGAVLPRAPCLGRDH